MEKTAHTILALASAVASLHEATMAEKDKFIRFLNKNYPNSDLADMLKEMTVDSAI